MNVLIYKRTHHDDPQDGCFGCYDCLGRIRKRDFDAVIGVGALGAEAQRNSLDGKINWIGIGPRKCGVCGRGPLVTFDHFLNYGDDGPSFESVAPRLGRRMYSRQIRHLMYGLRPVERVEVERILARAKNAPPSPARRCRCLLPGQGTRCN